MQGRRRLAGAGAGGKVVVRLTVIENTIAAFVVDSHQVEIERLDKQLWRVKIDGRRYATFCTESRARTAGRAEARRLRHRQLP